jgi:excisionase family DNA binding protein
MFTMSFEPTENALLLSVPHAAKSLGVGARTLRSAIEDGQVHAIQIGQRQLIPRKEIERLASQRSEG